MFTLTRRFALIAVLTVLGLGLASSNAFAQRRIPGPITIRSAQPINPNYLVAPGLTMRQWAWNTRQYGRAMSSIPPYALGYNPYPQVVNYGPMYGNPYAFTNPYAGAFNPYVYGSFYGNPYNPYAGYGYSYLYQ